MTSIELIKAVNEEANKIKKVLTKDYFSGKGELVAKMLEIYPKQKSSYDIYETINNLSSFLARQKEY